MEWKMLFYIEVIYDILRPLGIFLWAFGNFVVIWYIFSPLWYVVPRKIWQPWIAFAVFSMSLSSAGLDFINQFLP
jgi:hypothetical protein